MCKLLAVLDMLDSKTWPDKFDFQHGDASIRRLAKQFQVDEISSVRGFREFKEIKDHSNIFDLKPLLTAFNTVAISSCLCERTYSAMNTTFLHLKEMRCLQSIYLRCYLLTVLDLL